MAAGDQTPAAFPFGRSDAPIYAVTLWPHRSMGRRGARRVMALLSLGLAIPVLAVGDWRVSAFLGVFALAAVALMWLLFSLNARAGRLTEDVLLWPDLIGVERREPGGRVRRWSANPYWVRVEVRTTRHMENYLTLAGGGRTIELGAFLTAEERAAFAEELRAALRRAAGAETG